MYYETGELTGEQTERFLVLFDEAVGTDREVNQIDDDNFYVFCSDLEESTELLECRRCEDMARQPTLNLPPAKPTEFNEWLDTFVSEKRVCTETLFEVEGPEWGMNLIPCEVVLEHIRMASPDTQAKIKDELVKIDSVNGNVMDYFRWLATPIAR